LLANDPAAATASVLVVVLAVSRVATSVMHVVDMVPVRYRHMAAALTVHMVMRLMHHVAGRLAFVVVTLMLSMKVAVVHVVDMIPVWDRDVTTSFAVRMIMRTVLVVGRLGHYFSPPIPEFDSRDHGPTEAKRSPLALHRARIFTVPGQ
jgi:hypothetical protein